MKKLAFLFSIIFTSMAMALDVPSLTRPVEDKTGILSQDDVDNIEREIRRIHEEGTFQMSVLMIDTLDGENLEDYSMKVAESWKLGTKEKGDGLLLLIAIKDRKMRVEVGEGLEGRITDIDANRAISTMRPFFRREEYGQGIIAAVKNLDEIANLNTPEKMEEKRLEKDMKALQEARAIFFLVCIWAVIIWIRALMPSKAVSLKKTLSDTQAETAKTENQLEQKEKMLSAIVVDQKNLAFHQDVKKVNSLKEDIINKKNEIANMKKYLGES